MIICGQISPENLSLEYIANIRIIRILLLLSVEDTFRRSGEKIALSILALEQKYSTKNILIIKVPIFEEPLAELIMFFFLGFEPTRGYLLKNIDKSAFHYPVNIVQCNSGLYYNSSARDVDNVDYDVGEHDDDNNSLLVM